MYLDQRWATNYPDPDYSFELAARLLAACPNALAGLKTPKEIFDKTVELADMFYAHIHKKEIAEHEEQRKHGVKPKQFFKETD